MQIQRPGRASVIPSETPNPDEGMRVVQRSEPHSRIIYSDSIEADPQTSSEVTESKSSTRGRLLLWLGFIVCSAIFAGGVIHWIQSRYYPVVVAISPPDERLIKDPLDNSGPLIPLSPELLHVTSIALGNPRLTIVNGRRLAEEEWLVVKTSLGEASVRVLSIQDGFVRFKHGGETIDARLQFAQAGSSPH
ncbi:MAG TPA: hypothetical protein VLK27_11935 [Chthoniobacterales bacterium]|nr:hypothetical protein [Chthoniobacterales bacterium]